MMAMMCWTLAWMYIIYWSMNNRRYHLALVLLHQKKHPASHCTTVQWRNWKMEGPSPLPAKKTL